MTVALTLIPVLDPIAPVAWRVSPLKITPSAGMVPVGTAPCRFLTIHFHFHFRANPSTYSYHGLDATYELPNDEKEVHRLDKLQIVMHHIWRHNILAPISSKPARILDVGTGTGAWVVEVADRYPSAYVWGVDLSPIQPTFVPPNAEFMILDLHTELGEFAPCSFDLVHSRYCSPSFSAFADILSVFAVCGVIVDAGRMLTYGVKEDQWDPYLRNVLDLLIPGNGWAQFSELTTPRWDDDAVPPDAPFAEVPTQIRLTSLEPKTPLFRLCDYGNSSTEY